MDNMNEQWIEVDIVKLAGYLAEKEFERIMGDKVSDMQTAEIEDGYVKQVWNQEAAERINQHMQLYQALIMTFVKK